MAWLSRPRWVPGGDTVSPAAGARNFCSPRGPASAFPQGSAAPAAGVGLAAAAPLPRADLCQPHEPTAGTALAPGSAKPPEPGREHTAAPSGWDQQGFLRGGEWRRTCQPGSPSIFPWLHSAQVLLSDHRGHPVHPQPCCRPPWPRSLLQPGRAAGASAGAPGTAQPPWLPRGAHQGQDLAGCVPKPSQGGRGQRSTLGAEALRGCKRLFC